MQATTNYAAIRQAFYSEIATGCLDCMDAPEAIPAGSVVSWAGGYGQATVSRPDLVRIEDDAFASFFGGAA